MNWGLCRPLGHQAAHPRMDADRFDALSRTIHRTPTRRGILGVLAGLSLTRFSEAADAKRKRKKKKRRPQCPAETPLFCPPTSQLPNGQCVPAGFACCPSSVGGGACPATGPCCPPGRGFNNGACAPAGVGVCCSLASGGGACPIQFPNCCPPTPQDPGGGCFVSGTVCCSAATGGGACLIGDTCCPPSPAFPDGSCAPRGVPCLRSVRAEQSGLRERQTGTSGISDKKYGR
jgi:hypothetical protein